MTHLGNGTVVTELDNATDNSTLSAQGYTIRHIGTWHDHNQTCIVWDAPEITDADLPF